MPVARRLRFLGSLAAAVVLAGTVVPVHAALGPFDPNACRFAGHFTPAGSVRFGKDQGADWTRIKGPEYDASEGSAAITKMAVSPKGTHQVYATNGVALKRSADYGCTWGTRMFPAADSTVVDTPGDAADLGHIVDIGVSRGSAEPDKLWVLSYDGGTAAHRPHIYVSDQADGANPVFREAVTGLPAVARPLMIRPSGGPVAFAVLDVLSPTFDAFGGLQTAPGPALFWTLTAGKDPDPVGMGPAAALFLAWTRGYLPSGFTGVDGLYVNPKEPFEMWAWQGSKISHSQNGGMKPDSWSAPFDTGGQIVSVDAFVKGFGENAEKYVNVFVNGTANGAPASWMWETKYTVDPKTHYMEEAYTKRIGLPVSSIESVARAGDPRLFVLKTPKGITGFDLRLNTWVDLTPAGNPKVQLQLVPAEPAPVLLARGESEFYRYPLFYPNLLIQPPRGWVPPTDLNIDWLVERRVTRLPAITPRAVTVAVDPGQVAQVPMELFVPPVPTPLDVFFLVDTTESMTPTIESLRQGLADIVGNLLARGIDVNFGVGGFKDVTDVPPNSCDITEVQCVYRVYRKVRPMESEADLLEMRMALGALSARGGGDKPEAQTIALTQAATGAGDPASRVPGQLDAGFRADSVKVIMMLTDANFHEGGAQNANYPEIPQVVDTLTNRNINVIGIVPRNAGQPTEEAMKDVAAVVVGTKTKSEIPVDCDGDKKDDVKRGGPLWCVTDGNNIVNIAPAVTGLLLGIRDPRRVTVNHYAPPGIVRNVRGLVDAVRNVKVEVRVPFVTDVSCGMADAGQTRQVELRGAISGNDVAKARITVNCRALPVEPPPPPIFIPPIVIPPVAIVPPPPPPAPPQPVNNPNPNPNINPNTGMASQEEQQFQLASVTQGEGENQDQEETELAMSRLDHERDVAAAPVLLGGMLMSSLAAGAMMRRRLRSAEVRVRTCRVADVPGSRWS